jgi:hypothetical protein
MAHVGDEAVLDQAVPKIGRRLGLVLDDQDLHGP